jgi:hypothetical protein
MIAGCATINAATISGTVSSADDAPLAGIFIALRTTTTAAGTTVARDTTDSIGTYSVTCDSTSGTYVIRSTHPTGQYVMRYDTVALDGTDKTVNVKMARIEYVKVSGTVTDSTTGKAIAGAAVRLTNNRRDTTDTAGAYSFDSVASGTYTMSASAAGYVAANASLTVSGADPQTVNFKLMTMQYSSLAGTVTDSATGKAIAGAIVRLGNTRRDTTDSAGAYAFDSVVTGANSITASATGYVTKSVSDTVTATANTLDFALAPIQYTSVSGTVKDSATGDAIAGAIVSIGTGTTSKRDTTDADGKYTLDSVTAGVNRISVSATDYISKTISDTVPATAQTLDIILSPTIVGSVSGTVTDSATGKGIEGAIVSIGTGMGAATRVDTTDADGKYTLAKVATRTTSYTIQVSATGYLAKSDTVMVRDTTARTKDFALSKVVYFKVSGVVKDSVTGSPIAGATVILRGQRQETLDSIVTDSTGAYAVDSALTGSTLRVSKSGYTTKRVTLSGSTPDPQTINVLLVVAPAVRYVSKIQDRQHIVFADGTLQLKNMSEPGTVYFFTMKGERIMAKAFSAGGALSVRLDKALAKGNYLLKIAQKKAVVYGKVTIR